MNQQRWPDLNSHAGQFCLISSGHFRTAQQGLTLLLATSFEASKNKAWRSVCTGTFLHPCSKLCMVLRELPNNWANCFWVFPKCCRIRENSLLSIQPLTAFPPILPPLRGILYPRSGWFRVQTILWLGRLVFFNQRHNFLFIFRNRNTGILGEAVQKDHGIENLTARYTMPAMENVFAPVKFLECHPATTPLAVYSIFLVIWLGLIGHYFLSSI